MKTVKVHLYSQSEPIFIQDALNTYTKDGLFCVWRESGVVDKFPLLHIFRVTEKGVREAGQ